MTPTTPDEKKRYREELSRMWSAANANRLVGMEHPNGFVMQEQHLPRTDLSAKDRRELSRRYEHNTSGSMERLNQGHHLNAAKRV